MPLHWKPDFSEFSVRAISSSKVSIKAAKSLRRFDDCNLIGSEDLRVTDYASD